MNFIRLVMLSFLKGVAVILLAPFHKVRARGLRHLPKSGGALLTPNHQSYLDAVLLSLVSPRPVRFVINREISERWWVRPFAWMNQSIPVEPTGSPRALVAALIAARETIESGSLLCVFPEGQLSRNGQVNEFRRGVLKVMQGLQQPVIPVGIDGSYDSAFGFKNNEFNFWGRVRFFGQPQHIVFGEPISSESTLFQLRQAVLQAYSQAFQLRRLDARPLHREAVKALRRSPRRKLLSDAMSDGLAPGYKLLSGAAILGRKLKPLWEDRQCVAILLPPSIGAVVVNLAASLAGRVPINLNYTASTEILDDICQRSRVRTIITARLFEKKASLKIPDGYRVVYLEELRKEIGTIDKLRGLVEGLLLPVSWWERSLGRERPARPEDVATLVFSSGSTGKPKGVMLTHWNIGSNIQQIQQSIDLEGARFLGILPFFHSFGMTATLWLPLIGRIGVSYYPSPLEAKAIGETVEKYQVTHLIATPTFASNFLRRVEPQQFASLKFALTGAEKLRPSLSDAFQEKFGIPLHEGYGVTECAPVIAMNAPDVVKGELVQRGGKVGSVGRVFPGMEARVLALDSGETLPPGYPGMLHVRGPNVMKGYLRMREKTAEVLKDGWYTTGDIAEIDEEGYITITDRLARFSKIGGEMVPHGRVEEALHAAIGASEQVFAVTGVPDEKRGERLVVLYTPEADIHRAFSGLKGAGLPALFQPKISDFHPIETIPRLGSGKLDLQWIKETAKAVTQSA